LSSTELTSHAAAVRAARIAFAQKEASKARKLEEQQKKKMEQRDERRHHRSVSHMVKTVPITTAVNEERHRRTISEAYVHSNRNGHQHPRESYIDLEEDMTPDQITSMPSLPGRTTSPSSALGPPKLPAATKHNWNKFLTWGKTRYYKAKRKVSVPVSTLR
jgi:hypothetical protein